MKTIFHISMSLDGCVTGFPADMAVHYGVVMDYKPGLILVGSETAKTGAEEQGIPPEKKSDRKKTGRTEGFTWAFVDSKGKLEGILHLYRRFELCRDICVLVSEKTPKKYLKYLAERQIDYYVCGKNKVDLSSALELLSNKYRPETCVVESGGVLLAKMLEAGLIDELSLLVYPLLVGKQDAQLFRVLDAPENIRLELKTGKKLGGIMHLVYEVAR